MARSSIPESGSTRSAAADKTETPIASERPEGAAAARNGPKSPDMDTLKTDARTAVDEARKVAGQVAQEAGQQAASIAEEAKAEVGRQAERVKGMAGEQKDFLAAQIGGVADAMEKVADELETNNGASAHYARMIADNAEKVSATIRQNDIDALLGMAQDFGRRQPAVFVGAAALLGFAASRFLGASAARPHEPGVKSNATAPGTYTQPTAGTSAQRQSGRV